MDGQGTVRVTPMYGDTLTYGGWWGSYSSDYPKRLAIHGRSGVCQSNSGVGGYFSIGGRIAVAIHGWSGDCQSNSGVRGYFDIEGYSSGYPWMVRGLSE